MVKFLAMGVLLGADAARQEGTTMFQVGDLATDQSVSREERLSSMKQQILSVIEAGVPEAALPFLATIKSTLTDDILPTIATEYNLGIDEYNTRYGAFGAAQSAYDAANAGVDGTEAPAATAAGVEHSECRALESTDHQETVTCRDQETVLQGDYDDDEAAVRRTAGALDAGVCLESIVWRTDEHLGTYQSAVNSHHDAVGEVIASRALLDAKQAECTTLDGDLATTKAGCDALQNAFEGAACDQSVAQKEANDAFNTAHNLAVTNFEADLPVWQAQSNDRVSQCQLVNTLVCYITALETHDDQAGLQAAAQACSDGSESHDCSGVTFTEDTVTPTQGAARDIPVAPCDGGFAYGAFPAGTSRGTCNACAGL